MEDISDRDVDKTRESYLLGHTCLLSWSSLLLRDTSGLRSLGCGSLGSSLSTSVGSGALLGDNGSSLRDVEYSWSGVS